MSPLVVEVLRENQVECRHQVHVKVVDDQARDLWRCGDLARPTFPRSAIKPMQAMLYASLAEPTDERSGRRLALAAASHWASAIHLDVLREWHHEQSWKDEDLICGPQAPRDADEQRRLILQNQPVCRLHNNCSGKHTAFLQYSRARGYPVKGYGDYDHPLQRELRDLLGEMSGLVWDRLPWGIDGCGIPTTLVPVENLLRLTTSFARGIGRDARVDRVVRAMRTYPEMVSGPQGFCSRFMTAAGGEWVVKTGAEGNYLGMNLRNGVCFYLKVEDGSSRASEYVVMEIGQRFSEDAGFRELMRRWQAEPLTNWALEKIGRLQIAANHP